MGPARRPAYEAIAAQRADDMDLPTQVVGEPLAGAMSSSPEAASGVNRCVPQSFQHEFESPRLIAVSRMNPSD
jgi:hypothetical protein